MLIEKARRVSHKYIPVSGYIMNSYCNTRGEIFIDVRLDDGSVRHETNVDFWKDEGSLSGLVGLAAEEAELWE